MSKPFIGLKKLWYGDILTAEPANVAAVKELVAKMTEVKNVHSDTWDYSQDDPDKTSYINMLTGKPYFDEVTSDGTKTISFTLGKYAYEDKAALQGGEVVKDGEKVVGWKSGRGTKEEIFKGIIAQTKTGNYVVFPYAQIVGKVDKQEHNLGLGVAAVAVEPDNESLCDEYWFEGEEG